MTMKLVLTGVRVLDLSRVLAGPWATQLLADLGAEVIKIEQPGKGDDTRAWGPPFAPSSRLGEMPLSTYFLCANRGKKSVTVDIRTSEGQSIIRKLARHSDVFVENFKVGGLAAYGLDYENIRVVRPDIIYCSITGFGQAGAMRYLPGYDLIVQAMGGLMSITGPAEGEAGSGSTRSGVAVADLFTGMYAATAILGALYGRKTSGVGQYIDLALLDVQIAMLANHATAALVTGQPPKRTGNAHTTIVPYQSFCAADGEIIVTAGNDGQFSRLCKVLSISELAADSRFATNAARVANRDQLTPMLARIFLTRDRAYWTSELRAAGIPCGPIQTVLEALDEPQIRSRGMVRDSNPPGIACPIHYSGAGTTHPSPPPYLGQHTDEILDFLKAIGSSDHV